MKTKALGEICRPKQWKTVSVSQLCENGYPVYGANGVIGKYKDFNHKKETILVTCRGATCGTLNICAPFSYVNGNAMALDSLDKSVDLRYLYYFLKGRGFHDVISGSAQPQIIRSAIERIEVPICNIGTQKEITKRFTKIEDIIKNKKRLLADLDNLIKARFVEMFEDNFGEIVELGNVCDVRDGTHDSPKYHNEGYPLVTSKNICNGKIDFSTCNLIQKEDYDKINKRSKVEIGDILMPMIGTVGNPIIINTNNEFAIKNVALIKFKDNSVILNTFVKALLESDYFGRAVLSKTKGGTQKFISLGDIRKLELNLPPIELQNQFAAFVAQVDKSKFALRKSIISLMNLWYNINQYVCERTYGEA